MSHLWIGNGNSDGVLIFAIPGVFYVVYLSVIGLHISHILPSWGPPETLTRWEHLLWKDGKCNFRCSSLLTHCSSPYLVMTELLKYKGRFFPLPDICRSTVFTETWESTGLFFISQAYQSQFSCLCNVMKWKYKWKSSGLCLYDFMLYKWILTILDVENGDKMKVIAIM